jgi:orotidine-5'-phosphate decarboxylase
MGFGDRLEQAAAAKKSCLVVGLDPVLEGLPGEVTQALRGAASGGEGLTARAGAAFALFLSEVIALVADVAVAVKPNTAFFERYGAAGWDSLREVCRQAKKAGLLVIADAKRGDVAHTAAAYAEAFLGDLPDTLGPHVDAVTVNPYLGLDSVEPYLRLAVPRGKGIFVLVRTSNPSSRDFQDLDAGGRPLSLRVAEEAARWGEGLAGRSGLGPIGAVVGATAPAQAAAIRALMPASFFLVPGVGAQGGKPEDLEPYFLPGGRGAVVNASRSILFAFQSEEGRKLSSWREAVRRAAIDTRDALEAVRERCRG